MFYVIQSHFRLPGLVCIILPVAPISIFVGSGNGLVSNMSRLIIRKQVSNILLCIFQDILILSNDVKMHKRFRAVRVLQWHEKEFTCLQIGFHLITRPLLT